MGSCSRPRPAEVIRASHRDDEVILRLKQDIDEMILEVFGQRVWIRCQQYSAHISGIIYYTLTTFSGFQTLGEEHEGFIQVDSSGNSIPSRKALSFMIFTQLLGSKFVKFVIKIIENFYKRQRDLTKSSNLPLKYLLHASQLFLRFQPFMKQLHLILFYMDGKFYKFSKRLTGIHYIFIRPYFGNTNEDAVTKRKIRYIMWLSIMNLLVSSIGDFYKYLSSSSSHAQKSATNSFEVSNTLKTNAEKDVPHIYVDPLKNCSLCLGARRHPSLTPCGHTFCWGCIINWLTTEECCPICREHNIVTSRIVPLLNII